MDDCFTNVTTNHEKKFGCQFALADLIMLEHAHPNFLIFDVFPQLINQLFLLYLPLIKKLTFKFEHINIRRHILNFTTTLTLFEKMLPEYYGGAVEAKAAGGNCQAVVITVKPKLIRFGRRISLRAVLNNA